MTGNQTGELVVDKLGVSFASPDFESGLRVLQDISFTVNNGEFVSIVGPSGCGKTTLLNSIAGFEPIREGKITYNGDPLGKPSPERAVVFQSAVLFPWLTVEANVAYGLKRTGISRVECRRRVNECLHMVKMQGFENYYPEQLSGGMQQRVALARALVLEPLMLLMDEPFAALDAQTRLTMQEQLLDIQPETTTILVTHDVEEALYLADRVYVLSARPGKIISEVPVPFAKPRTLALRATPAFVALKTEILQTIINQVI